MKVPQGPRSWWIAPRVEGRDGPLQVIARKLMLRSPWIDAPDWCCFGRADDVDTVAVAKAPGWFRIVRAVTVPNKKVFSASWRTRMASSWNTT